MALLVTATRLTIGRFPENGPHRPAGRRRGRAPVLRRFFSLTAGFLVLGVGCGGGQNSNGSYRLESIDDPAVLPYRFVVESHHLHEDLTLIHPVDFNADGIMESYQIQSGRHITGRMSHVLLYSGVTTEGDVQQFNINGTPITDSRAADLDGDGLKEIAVAYTYRDTVWLEVLHPDRGSIYRRGISTGLDKNGDGFWDGSGAIVGVYDFTGDGRAELLIKTYTGFDLYPRSLTCLDWYRDSVLWTYAVAGDISEPYVQIVTPASEPDPYVVLSTGSPCNGAEINGMDDFHSYVIVLDAHGHEKWRREVGRAHTGAGRPVVIQYDDDADPEILLVDTDADRGFEVNGAAHDPAEIGLVVCDLSGAVVDSLPLPRGVHVPHLLVTRDPLSGDTLLLLGLGNNSFEVRDQRLNRLAQLRYETPIQPLGLYDILGIGESQFLVSTSDAKLWLLSRNFEPLAMRPDMRGMSVMGVFRPTPDALGVQIAVSTESHRVSHLLSVAKAPWFAVFSRYPILAFAAAFVPLSALALVIWTIMLRFRQKNRVIGDQRDKLEQALTNLHEAQEQLIAAEKFQQARDIAGGVAHEIHNALYPAVASLDTLRRRLVARGALGNGKDNTLWDLTESAVSRAIGMTELVRDYTRLESETSRERVNLRALVGEIAAANQPRIEALNATWDVTIPAATVIACRRTHAYSLFNNLVSNALDAVADSAKRRIAITAHISDRRVTVRIADTGPGVPEGDRKRIFNAFYSTKPQSGTGLGLAIARRIAELYDGNLTVTTNDAGGATFVVGLPAAAAEYIDKEQTSIGADG